VAAKGFVVLPQSRANIYCNGATLASPGQSYLLPIEPAANDSGKMCNPRYDKDYESNETTKKPGW